MSRHSRMYKSGRPYDQILSFFFEMCEEKHWRHLSHSINLKFLFWYSKFCLYIHLKRSIGKPFWCDIFPLEIIIHLCVTFIHWSKIMVSFSCCFVIISHYMVKVLLNTHLPYDWIHGVNVCELIDLILPSSYLSVMDKPGSGVDAVVFLRRNYSRTPF